MKEKIEIGDLIVNLCGDIGIVEHVVKGIRILYKVIDSKEEKKISRLITTDIDCVSKFYGNFFVKY